MSHSHLDLVFLGSVSAQERLIFSLGLAVQNMIIVVFGRKVKIAHMLRESGCLQAKQLHVVYVVVLLDLFALDLERLRSKVGPLVLDILEHDRVPAAMLCKVVRLSLLIVINDHCHDQISEHNHNDHVVCSQNERTENGPTLSEGRRAELAQNDQERGLEGLDEVRAALCLVIVHHEYEAYKAYPNDREHHQEVQQMVETALECLQKQAYVSAKADHLEELDHANEGAYRDEHHQQIGPVADLLQADHFLHFFRVRIL